MNRLSNTNELQRKINDLFIEVKQEAIIPAQEIKTTNCLIAFLDIMGYKNLMRNREAELKQSLQFTKGLIDKGIKLLDLNLAISFFSDTIVITYDLNNFFEHYNAYNVFFHLIGLMQCTLALKGILLRGGIEVGSAYNKDSIIFGEGIISAHLLEKAADTPRIIVSENLMKKLRASEDYKEDYSFDYSKDYSYFDYLKIEGDKHYIDYLKMFYGKINVPSLYSSKEQLDATVSTFKKSISALRELIITELELNNPEYINKYRWLKNYFNSSINRLIKSSHRNLKSRLQKLLIS